METYYYSEEYDLDQIDHASLLNGVNPHDVAPHKFVIIVAAMIVGLFCMLIKFCR